MALTDNIRDFPRHLMLHHYYFALIHPVCVQKLKACFHYKLLVWFGI